MTRIIEKHFFHGQCYFLIIYKCIDLKIMFKTPEIQISRTSRTYSIIAHHRLGMQETILIEIDPHSRFHDIQNIRT